MEIGLLILGTAIGLLVGIKLANYLIDKHDN